MSEEPVSLAERVAKLERDVSRIRRAVTILARILYRAGSGRDAPA